MSKKKFKKIKCKNFEVYCRNSDAECFYDTDDMDAGITFSKNTVKVNPDVCNYCVYNSKFEKLNYDDWKALRKGLGIPVKEK